jgi:hypothetical protein
MSRGLFLILMVVASALVLTAAASSSPLDGSESAPPDPAGDSGVAPDITAVSMANDNAGKLTWRITLGNRTQFLAPDFVSIYIDADFKDTGEDGFEFLFQADPAQGPALFKWNGDWQDTQSKTVSSSFANGVLEMSVDFREMDSELFVFWVYGDQAPADSDEQWDEAPNTGIYSYFADVPLLIDNFTKPARVSAGKAAKLSLSAWTNNSTTAKVTCTGRIGSKKIKGKAVSAVVSVGVPASNGQLVVTSYREQGSCSFAVPRSARGKIFSGRITVLKGGVSLSRTLAGKVR